MAGSETHWFQTWLQICVSLRKCRFVKTRYLQKIYSPCIRRSCKSVDVTLQILSPSHRSNSINSLYSCIMRGIKFPPKETHKTYIYFNESKRMARVRRNELTIMKNEWMWVCACATSSQRWHRYRTGIFKWTCNVTIKSNGSESTMGTNSAETHTTEPRSAPSVCSAFQRSKHPRQITLELLIWTFKLWGRTSCHRIRGNSSR